MTKMTKGVSWDGVKTYGYYVHEYKAIHCSDQILQDNVTVGPFNTVEEINKFMTDNKERLDCNYGEWHHPKSSI